MCKNICVLTLVGSMLECGTTVTTTAPASISQPSSAAGTGPGPSRSIKASPELSVNNIIRVSCFRSPAAIYQIPFIY